jgi:hypothetical protein
MGRYRFLRAFQSGGYDGVPRRFVAGDIAELSDDLAAWITRNAGQIVPVDAPARAVEQPPHDRMQQPRRKRGRGTE